VGERPPIEDDLGQIAEPYRAAMLRDLLAAELHGRGSRGEQPGAAEYAARCPEFAEQVLHLFLDGELIATPKTALDERLGRSYDIDAGREPVSDATRRRGPQAAICSAAWGARRASPSFPSQFSRPVIIRYPWSAATEISSPWRLRSLTSTGGRP
jgi:hypothetical protein